jgi:N-acylneuraminate cytidylyltransferase
VAVALIPVRGGSKSIPKKNIKMLAGQPLLHWVTKAALAAPAIDEVFVSSDSREILGVAGEIGHPKLRLIERDPILAQDTTSTEAVLLDFAAKYAGDPIVLIQATSPLLTTSDLQAALEKLVRDKLDALLSVTRERRFRWREAEDGSVGPDNYDPRKRPRRQEWAGELMENGAFYISTRAALEKSACRISGRIGYWEMPLETALEIDEPADWEILEAMMRSRA